MTVINELQACLSGVPAPEIVTALEVIAANIEQIKDDVLKARLVKPLQQLLKRKASFALSIAQGFEFLKEAGGSIETHFKVYEGVLYSASDLAKIINAFAVLDKIGASLQRYQELYLTVVRNAWRADKINIDNFLTLSDIGATLEKHTSLYIASLEHTFEPKMISNGFIALSEYGCSIDTHLELYELMLRYDRVSKMIQGFAALKDAGALIKTHHKLYEMVIRSGDNGDKKGLCFAILIKAGVSLETDIDLYESVYKKFSGINEMLDAFKALEAVGAKTSNFQAYLKITNENSKWQVVLDINASLRKMNVLGMNVARNENFIKTALIFPDAAIFRLNSLEKLGFNYKSHAYLYEFFLGAGDNLNVSSFNFSKILVKFESYLSSRALLNPDDEGYDTQCNEIKRMIEDVDDTDVMTQGPVNKSAETAQLERLLHKIIKTDLDQIKMHYDESLGYIIQLPDEPDIYLSLLLNQANFNHLELTTEQVESLGNVIAKIAPGFNHPRAKPGNLFVSRLPTAAQKAIAGYVGVTQYKNMNRLFRGEPQTTERDYVWISPVSGKENLLANFLNGCLVNWSAAELPRLIYDSEERKALEKILAAYPEESIETYIKDHSRYLERLEESLSKKIISEGEHKGLMDPLAKIDIIYPNYQVIDRVEDLESESSTLKRRLANVVALFSMTSASVNHQGIFGYNIRTVFDPAFRRFPVVYPSEGEIIIPHGTYILSKKSSGMFFAREVNGPGVVPHEDYWSSQALAEVYKHHLSKRYPDETPLKINRIEIPRCNHGVAHTYRVMQYVSVVINYFAHHAKEEKFKSFCQSMTSTEESWLKVAAAYSVSGRKSEISHSDVGYQKMREACVENLQTFLASRPPKIANPNMEEAVAQIIQHMGNPHFETSINQHEIEDERRHRNYLHRIISFAHKLDLARCYDATEYKHAMNFCDTLSEISREQQIDFQNMVRYAIDLIKAHGGALRTDFSASGEYVHSDRRYTSPFETVSTNLQQLKLITETVTRPNITEAYQFPRV